MNPQLLTLVANTQSLFGITCQRYEIFAE